MAASPSLSNVGDVSSPHFVPRDGSVEEGDILKLFEFLEMISQSMKQNDFLRADLHTLQKLMHKGTNQHRHMKWFQMIKMTQKACRKLELIDPSMIAQNILNGCKRNNLNRQFQSCNTLPSKETVKQLLYRLLDCASLSLHICSKSLTIFSVLLQNFRLGNHLLTNHLLFLTIFARIHVFISSYLEQVISWYGVLYAVTQLLTTSDTKQDADMALDLPDDLKTWLGEDYVTLKSLTQSSDQKKKPLDLLSEVFNSSKNDISNEEEDGGGVSDAHIHSYMEDTAEQRGHDPLPIQKEDVGVPVSQMSSKRKNVSPLEAYNPPTKKKKKKKKKKSGGETPLEDPVFYETLQAVNKVSTGPPINDPNRFAPSCENNPPQTKKKKKKKKNNESFAPATTSNQFPGHESGAATNDISLTGSSPLQTKKKKKKKKNKFGKASNQAKALKGFFSSWNRTNTAVNKQAKKRR